MRYQTANSMRMLAVGLVAIAAVSVGAASIDSATGTGVAAAGPVVDLPGGEGVIGNLNVTGPETNRTVTWDFGGPEYDLVANLSGCVEPLAAWWGGLVYFGAFGGVLYGIRRLYSLGASVMGAYALSPVAFTGYFLQTDCPSALGPSGPVVPPGPWDPGADPSLIPVDVSPWLVAGVLGLALVAVAAVLYRATGDQTVPVEPTPEQAEPGAPDVADLAAAAGRAADRLADHNADVDNAVYRAWWEMTAMLRMPDPETSTPGEFADAAVDVGMAAEDVDQLTTLFEEVRYGRRDPESREDRALDVFRNIEAAYAADLPGDDDPSIAEAGEDSSTAEADDDPSTGNVDDEPPRD